MTFIIGSSNGSSGNSDNTTSSNMPVGGVPFSLSSGMSYAIPANTTLVVSTIVGVSTITGNSGDASAVNVSINGNLIAIVGPSFRSLDNTVQTSSGSQAGVALTSGHPSTIPCQLVYKAGTTIALSATGGTATLAGYTITTSESTQNSTLNEGEATNVWWQTGVISPYTVASSVSAKVVPVGDGKALLIKNGILDKNSRLLDIETGTETAIYNGTAAFDLNNFWFIKAAYQDTYQSGASITRLVCGSESADNWAGGTTEYLIEVRGTAAASAGDSDFKIKTLPTIIYGGVNSGKVYNTQFTQLVLGFAGIDYLVTCNIDFNITANYLRPLNIYSHNISVSPTTVTTVATQFASITDFGITNGSTGSYKYGDLFCRAKAIRGNNGKLYIYLHAANTNNSYYNSAYFGYQVVVVNSNGQQIGQLNATNVAAASVTSAVTSGTNNYAIGSAMPASIALSSHANGSEKLLAVVPHLIQGSSSTYSSNLFSAFKGFDIRQQQFTFNSSGGAVTNDTNFINKAFSTSLLTSASFPSIPEAPVNDRLGSYFNKLGVIKPWDPGLASGSYSFINNPTVITSNYYRYAHMLQSSPSQQRRTNGVFYGNQSGWYYPTGLFVEKRQYPDFGLLNTTNSVVQTKIINPVQAITSLTKLLIVGVDGSWEIVTP